MTPTAATNVPADCFVAGVDTHADTHTLAILTAQGGVVHIETFAANSAGYDQLLATLRARGPVTTIGIEGTNSYGAGLARKARHAGFTVKEVLRPTRQVRRMHGKSDSLDAVQAARNVLASDGISDAKDTDTPAEALRFLLAARSQMIATMTAVGNSVQSLLVTAPEPLRAQYRGLNHAVLIKTLARTRPPTATPDTPSSAAVHALRSMARIYIQADQTAQRFQHQMHEILTAYYPAMLDIYGAGPIVAAQLVVTAGGNPTRIRNEAAFAQLCGVAPIPASSGKTHRHRLNRGGDRRGNQALHRIALVRLRHDPRTRDYANRRASEGKTRKEILRCLKRAIAREAYRALTNPTPPHHPPTQRDRYTGTELRALRQAHHLTQTDIAKALKTYPARISDIENNRRPLPTLTQQYTNWIKALDTQ